MPGTWGPAGRARLPLQGRAALCPRGPWSPGPAARDGLNKFQLLIFNNGFLPYYKLVFIMFIFRNCMYHHQCFQSQITNIRRQFDIYHASPLPVSSVLLVMMEEKVRAGSSVGQRVSLLW